MLPYLLVVAGSFFFSLMSLCVKFANKHSKTSTFALLAVRSALGLVFNVLAPFVQRLCTRRPAGSDGADGALAAAILGGGCPSIADRSAWTWLLVRSLGGFGCIILEYMALRVIPLGTATMIVYTSPAWIVLWAALLIGEPIRPLVVACLGACFGGLLLMVRPWSHQHAGPLWAYALSLVSAIFAGLGYVSLRQLKGVSYHVVMNVFLLVCLVMSIFTGAALGQLAVPPLNSPAWAYIVGVGLSAYVAEVCITVGFARGRKSLGRLSVLKFLSPIFSSIWGVIFLGELPGAAQLGGAAIVLAASAVIVYQRTSAPQDEKKGRSRDETENGHSDDGINSTEEGSSASVSDPDDSGDEPSGQR